jgi:hypothetical protein
MHHKISVLHIGKTGGTAVRDPLRKFKKTKPPVEIGLPTHNVGLREVIKTHPERKVVFFIREPVSRFVSGFNSRLRKGAPRHFYEWSAAEALAFETFKTPNALAEALGSWRSSRRRAAEEALKAMRHTRWGYEFYLGSVRLLEKEKDRILLIGAQEQLDEDFEVIKEILNMGPEYCLPRDEIAAHRTPDGFDTHVSAKGRRNLMKHYQADYEIYAWCKAHRLFLLDRWRQQLPPQS